eukprot:CAMPEP_0202912310 /NCGR_PEP_ID=MMETSP1392-20130828/57399_1 /ASSEMBLY_ACC=CAM_ASM_000868 /TAXON_ID=225041 /ORGANISM="Chlamydomonas chlamydogama, Strain SAG 11-48b" /LENGTH=357 /DNA_ID=CAMNT_0049603175 /DNA_START=225 /DNA_END=1298 /DNA_ORIENTATION=+
MGRSTALWFCAFGFFSFISHAHAAKYPDCPNVKWEPACAFTSLPSGKVQITEKEIVLTAEASTQLGDMLTTYWQARAMAHLAGLAFRRTLEPGSHSFVMHLPSQVPRRSCADPEAFKRLCQQCPSVVAARKYKCSTTWISAVLPQISEEIPQALKAWAAEARVPLHPLQHGDVLIQKDCAADNFLLGGPTSLVGFSYYRSAPPTTQRFLIVHHLGATRKYAPCAVLYRALASYLREHYPAAKVMVVADHLVQDFTRLTYATTVFRDSQSSYGLWACLGNLGTGGTVYSVPLRDLPTDTTKVSASPPLTPDWGPNWHWATGAKVLYRDVLIQAGLPLRNHSSDPTPRLTDVIAYLRTH